MIYRFMKWVEWKVKKEIPADTALKREPEYEIQRR